MDRTGTHYSGEEDMNYEALLKANPAAEPYHLGGCV